MALVYKVYMHIAPNGKRYIGITNRDLKKRWKNGNGYYNNSHFYNAIKKYGWDNISHILLFDNLSKEEAEKKEIELIAKYKTTDRKYGYNRDNGGNTQGTHSKATRWKLHISHLGHKRTHFTEEEKKIHSDNLKQRWHSIEGRKKLIEGLTKANGVKVMCVETGQVFNTIKEANEMLGANKSHISSCCNGERKTCGGYHWKKVSD